MIGIYKITSPTGKIYIGQSIDIDRRWVYYKNIQCKSQVKLYNSLKKYGWKQHQSKKIEECDKSQLNEREIYWKQVELDKVNNNWSKVLFCGLYDAGGGPKSNEHRLKISLSNKKPKTQEHKDNMSIGKKGLTYNIYHYIIQYNKNKEFIKEWTSTKEISKTLNIKVQSISNNLNNISKTAGNFIFKYKQI